MQKDIGEFDFDVRSSVESLDALSAVSGLDVTLFSPVANEADPHGILMHHDTGGCRRCCPHFTCENGDPGWNLECRKSHIAAGMLADRHGGTYVYICPEEKVFIAAPVICKRSLCAIMTLGPADVSEEDEEPACHDGFEPYPQRNSETFHQLVLLLNSIASSVSDGPQTYLRRVGSESTKQNARVLTNIDKSIRKSKQTRMREYPITSEARLFKAVKNADPINAVAALDNIFEYFFTSAASKGEYADMEHLGELVVIISRAGLDAGVDTGIVFNASEQCKRELRYISTSEQAYRRVKFFVEEVTGFVQALHRLSFDDSIYRVQTYVQMHLSEEIHLEQVADAVGFSPAYLSRIFKEKTGTNFVAYVNQMRIEASKAELLSTDFSVSQVAQRCGFENVSYFTRVFKKFTGVTPAKYRLRRGQGEMSHGAD